MSNTEYVINTNKKAYRIPFYSLDKLRQVLMLSSKELTEFIEELCHNELFLEAVYISSKDLYNDLVRINSGKILSEKKSKDIKHSVLKYYLRMCSRTTPFGLFAAYGKSQANTSFHYKKTLWPDYEWLLRFSKILESEFTESLKYQLNGMLFQADGKYRIPYSMCGIPAETEKTKLSQAIIDYCFENRYYHEIKSEICSVLKLASPEDFHDTFLKLLKAGILISELTPSPNEKYYFNRILTVLGESFACSPHGRKLQKICRMIDQYEEGSNRSDLDLLKMISDEMEELLRSDKVLQVDTEIKGISFQPEENDFQTICEAVNLLVGIFKKIRRNHFLYSEYKDLFLQKYSENRLVPLLEMLDPTNGIGIPQSYASYVPKSKGTLSYPVVYEKRILRYLSERIQSAVCNKTNCILDSDFFSFLDSVESSSASCPNEVFVGFFCYKDSSGNNNFTLNQDLKPTSGDMLPFQRFYLFEGNNTSQNNEEYPNSDLSTCQLYYVPARSRWANVMREQITEVKRLTGYVWDDSQKKRISLTDIYVGIENNRFFLFDGQEKKKMRIITKNMYAYGKDADAIRFIKEVGKDNVVQITDELVEQYLSVHVYLPAIVYKNITLYPETWRLCESDFWGAENSFEGFSRRLAELISEYRIPDIVYCRAGDFGFAVNLRQSEAKEIVYKNWKKYHYLTFQCDPSFLNGIVLSNGEEYKLETVFSFSCSSSIKKDSITQPSFSMARNNRSSDRFLGPGSEWIYIKISGFDCMEKWIGKSMFPWCQKAISNGKAKKYFFIRYKDPFFHIRLRIQQIGSNSLFYDVISWLNDSISSNKIQFYEISAYERELERYGGKLGVELAETVFYFDSMIISQLSDKTKKEKEELYCCLAHVYLNKLFENPDERNQWLSENSPDRKEYHSFVKRFIEEKESDACSLLSASVFQEAIIVLEDAISNYSSFLRENATYKNSAINGLLHMSFNRLIGMDRELEKRLRAVIRYESYQQSMKRKHK